MTKTFVALLALCAVATPAEAGWQYTNWTMNPDQVVQASKGAVSRIEQGAEETTPVGVKQAVGTYAANGMTMKASFWFAAGKLNQVNLATEDVDACNSLRRGLVGVYGEAVSRSGGFIETHVWRDTEKGNRVQFSNWGTGGCDLIYSPLPKRENTGL